MPTKTKIQTIGQLGDIDIRLLKVFRSVVEAGGFSAATVNLGIGCSTISLHISDLEKRLNMRLCKRGRGGFKLTVNGKQVYQLTLSLLSSIDRFRGQLNEMHDQIIGGLRIGITDNMVWDPEFDLASVFRRYAEIAPDVTTTVEILPPERIEQYLLSHHLDLGILPCLQKVSELRYLFMFQEDNYLYCSKDHPLFDKDDTEISEAELRMCNYVQKAPVSKVLREAKRLFKSNAAAVDIEAIVYFLLSGKYIGFLPKNYARIWTEKGELRQIFPERFKTSIDFYVAQKRNMDNSLPTEVFLETFNEIIKLSENYKSVA